MISLLLSSSSSTVASSEKSTTTKMMMSPRRRRWLITKGAHTLNGRKKKKLSTLLLFSCASLNDDDDNNNNNIKSIVKTKSVVFVRHGQSTWEQGSSKGPPTSVLTELGKTQARRSAELLRSQKFDHCLRSPLQRAHRTAEVIWGVEERNREKMDTIDDLREIDLYAFQGLDKNDKETIEKREF